MKNWKEYVFDVNGFQINTLYSEETIETIFLPMLRKFTGMQKKLGRRLIVFLAAPPAVGKTTLSKFLEYLAVQQEDLTEIQAIGLDGFHYHSDYINTHNAVVMGKEVPMKKVKGCPETYDTGKLEEKLGRIKEEDILWPIYDRNIHDVVEDLEKITKDIVLIEGNWLLLDEEPWKTLKDTADYTILIRSEEETLKERLIGRKMKGGLTREEAEDWYINSDCVNVRRVLETSLDGDLMLKVEPDGDYTRRIKDEINSGSSCREKSGLCKGSGPSGNRRRGTLGKGCVKQHLPVNL